MSNNIGRTTVAPTQNDKTVTINNSDGRIDAALTELLVSDYTSADVTLTDDEFEQAVTFQTDNLSVARALNVPQTKKLFVVDNTTGSDIVTVTRGSGTVAIPATEKRLCYTDGTTNGLIEIGGAAGGVSDFLSLSDTPGSYSGQADKYLRVNPGESDLIFDIEPTTALSVNGMELIETRTVSASSGENFLDVSGLLGEGIVLVIDNWQPSVDGAAPLLTVSDDGGSTFKSTLYQWAASIHASNGFTADSESTSTTAVNLGAADGVGNDTGENFTVVVELGDFSPAAKDKIIYWSGSYIGTGGIVVRINGSGFWSGGTGALDAIRIFPSSGTYDATITVYRRVVAASAGSFSGSRTPVRVATVVAGTLASDFENGDTVDGITLATNDRILIKDQSTASENGIYTVNASAGPTRDTDLNTNTDVVLGSGVPVLEGTANAKTVWIHVSGTDIDTDDLVFESEVPIIPPASITTDKMADIIPGRRNLIMNGDMKVRQRSNTETDIDFTSDVFVVDRFKTIGQGTPQARVTMTQETTGGPPNNPNFLKIDTTTAEAAVAAGEEASIATVIEAQDLQHLVFGGGSALSTRLSFWMRSPKTGIHCVALVQPDATRSFIREFTIASADTFEFFELTFDGDASGTINNDNGGGLEIVWPMVAGTDFQVTADAWAAGRDVATSNQQNLLDNVANDIGLSDVQLEVGIVTTLFDRRPIAEELLACMRYFERMSSVNGGRFGIAQCFSTTAAGVTVHHTVAKRALPTVVLSAANTFRLHNAVGTSIVCNGISTANTSLAFVALSPTISATSLVAGNASVFRGDTGNFVDSSADL